MRRSLFAIVVLLLCGSILPIAGDLGESDVRAVAIRAEPVASGSGSRSKSDDALEFLGGWVLSSDDPRFGGVSAIAIDRDGFLAVSDAGGLFRFALDRNGRITRVEIATLPDGPAPKDGGPVRKRDRDAESMVYDPTRRRLWVGFERANAIWQYDLARERVVAHRTPAAMKKWPSNGGAEAIVRLADGRFVVISEAGEGPDNSREVLLFPSDPSTGNPAPIAFGYRPPHGFSVTDAAVLPDGRLLVLNRRFSVVTGPAASVTLVDLAAVAPGQIIEGREILRLMPPQTVDNMEAIVVQRVAGEAIVWLASDDNFNVLQRTLLLKFRLNA